MAMVEQIAGAVVTVVVLLDIFLTVLYARAGTALLSPVVARTVWLVLRSGGFKQLSISGPWPRSRG